MKKNIRVIFAAILVAAAVVGTMTACNPTATNPAESGDTTIQGTPGDSQPSGDASGSSDTVPANPADTSQGGTTVDPGATAIVLTFSGNQLNASVTDNGITVEGGAFVITRGGTYELRGDLSNGQVRVSVGKTADVELILNNFTASCNNSAPLYVESANKATIVLATGSVNSLTDAKLYQYATPGEDKPNACLYSSDDLTIEGKGTLTVTSQYNNGIGCKNDLRIKEGTITVTAPNNIIKGNDSVEIEEATVTLSGGEDAIKSDTTDRTDKGYVLITSGAKVTINCIDDALQATNSITVEAGATVTGTAGGDAVNCPGTINVDETAMQIKPAA